MYAPVVTRLRTYGVTVDTDTDAYCKAVIAHPAMKEWIDAAKNEPWLIAGLRVPVRQVGCRLIYVILSEAKDLIAACPGMRSFASLRMT